MSPEAPAVTALPDQPREPTGRPVGPPNFQPPAAEAKTWVTREEDRRPAEVAWYIHGGRQPDA